MNYEAAKVNCASKLPDGIIAEPRSLQVNDLVYKESEVQFGGQEQVWLGVGYSDEKRSFIYKSDGQTLGFTNWRSTSTGYVKRTESPYCVTWYDDGWYHSMNCNTKFRSICESL